MKRLVFEECRGCGGVVDPDSGVCGTPGCDGEPDE